MTNRWEQGWLFEPCADLGRPPLIGGRTLVWGLGLLAFPTCGTGISSPAGHCR